MNELKYLYIIEKGKRNYSAYVPDLPGCISTGKNKKDIEKNIQEAIEFHIEGMLLNGEKIPEPVSTHSGFFKAKPSIKANNKPNISRKKKTTA